MEQIEKIIDSLTDSFVLEMSDELFVTTMAYKAFTNKQTFINKISDKHVRFQMLKNVLETV